MNESPHPHGELPSLSSSLLDRVQQMQPDAWAQVVTLFGPIVYRWCRQSGLAGHDASDVVQDVFSSVARGIGRFERVKSQGSFRSWLATITRNRIRDHFRRRARQPVGEGGNSEKLQVLMADGSVRSYPSLSEEKIRQLAIINDGEF